MAYFKLLLTTLKIFIYTLFLIGVQTTYAQESVDHKISVQEFEYFLLEQEAPIGTCEQEYLLKGLSRLAEEQLIDTSRLKFLNHQYAFLIQDKELYNKTLPTFTSTPNTILDPKTSIFFGLICFLFGAIALYYFQQNRKKLQVQYELEEKIKRLELENNKAQQSQNLLQGISGPLSHDYKEPLRNISFFTKIIENDINGSKIPTQESFSYIYKSIDSIERLISSFSNFLNVGQNYNLRIERIPIHEAFELAKENLASQIKKLDVDIQWEGDKSFKYPMEKNQMVSIFQNLLGNSIKYRSEETPRIKVIQQVSDSTLRIDVIDNGLGISDKWKGEVFLPFVRLNTSKEEKGSGLGLSIVKKAITNLNGKIDYTINPTGGCKFTIELPLVQS